MALREELRGVDPTEVVLALAEQVVSDPPTHDGTMTQRAKWFSERLQEYPILDELLKYVCTISLGFEGASDEEIRSFISGAGIALLGVKAAANKQVFQGLETPGDLPEL